MNASFDCEIVQKKKILTDTRIQEYIVILLPAILTLACGNTSPAIDVDDTDARNTDGAPETEISSDTGRTTDPPMPQNCLAGEVVFPDKALENAVRISITCAPRLSPPITMDRPAT